MDLRKVNYPDFSTDTFEFSDAKSDYSGFVREYIDFIKEFDLKDPLIWQRFVEQYRRRLDTDDCGWRGEYWGKMMRGGSFLYRCTGDDELYNALEATVLDMLTVDRIDGSVTTYNKERRFIGWDIWSRKYVLLGMQYFLEICKSDELIETIIKFISAMVDDIMQHIGEGKIRITDATNHWKGMNSSSLLEPVVRLYNLTKDQKYFDFAKYIVDCGGMSVINMFELAYKDELCPYQYPATKAYEMTSCFEGLLEYYRITKEEKYKTAVINFANKILETDYTVIGSCGCTHELFDHSAVRQASDHIGMTMQETCVTVTLMKFFAKLNMLTGESKFMDAFEQSFYNAYLGAVNNEHRISKELYEVWPDAVHEPLPFDSYSPLTPGNRGTGTGGRKIMHDNHYYGCCACIGATGIAMLSMYNLEKAKDGYVLNFYINGTETADGITVKTDTEYPKHGTVNITLSGALGKKFAFYMRNPEWSRKTVISVNGDSMALNTSGGYIRLERNWSEGDIITLEFDMRTEVIYPIHYGTQILMNDVAWGQNHVNPSFDREDENAKRRIALKRGPVMLAVENRLGKSVDGVFDVKINEHNYVDVRFPDKDKAPYKHIVELEIPDNTGGHFTVTDYSSAGKTWDDDSRMAVWFFNK